MHQKADDSSFINKTSEYWNKSIDFYSKFDSTLQSFYFSIISLLNIPSANNILEIGCGRCLLVPYAIELKKKQSLYLATDLSEKMVESAVLRLKCHYQRYSSQITIESWMKQNNLQVQVLNGEQPIPKLIKFDRIICNMVIMLTQDANKMLQNFYDCAQSGCLLGISTWGIKQQNLYHSEMAKAVEQNGLINQISRCNYYLYNQLTNRAKQIGWNIIFKWQQTSPYPYLDAQAVREHSKTSISNMKFSEEQKDCIHKSFMKRISQRFENNQCMNFSSQIYILRKQH